MLYGSTYMKCPEKGNPQKEKVDNGYQELEDWGEKWGVTANEYKVSGVMRMFWNQSDDGSTTL